MNNFEIKHDSDQTKYKQLAVQIIQQIQHKELTLGQKLPSVNTFSAELDISRETVFSALNHLKERGIVYSKNRKGYFVNRTDVRNTIRVCLILNRFTTFKNKLIRGLQESIGERGAVDVFFHHHNKELLTSIIKDNLPNYTHVGVVTFFKEEVRDILNLIPPRKRLILDCKEPGLDGDYTMVYQDVAEDIFKALSTTHKQLQKYNRLALMGEHSHSQINQVEEGIQTYCLDYNFSYETIFEPLSSEVQKDTVYIIVSDSEQILANVVKSARRNRYTIGEDIGIICYDDTPMKEVLEGGITTISTDFTQMGHTAAELIIRGETHIVANTSQLILRNSL